jgi:hypothetical protein
MVAIIASSSVPPSDQGLRLLVGLLVVGVLAAGLAVLLMRLWGSLDQEPAETEDLVFESFERQARPRPPEEPLPPLSALFEEAATVYVRAEEERRDPTIAVAEHFGISVVAASRWIGAARDGYHFIEPADRRSVA